ncbi:MAG: hypothetical protein MJ051_02090 [Akkermansia sp.]|nr:hypothetical protein [Akkermansia sp.]
MKYASLTALSLALCTAAGAAEPTAVPELSADSAAPAPTVEELMAFRPAEAVGDTQLLWLCGLVANNPNALETLRPMIEQQLRAGADAYLENTEGCNALFYLHSQPELLQQLTEAGLIPTEPKLTIPTKETELAAYMKKRVHQAELAPTPGSRSYLVNRYCKPAARSARTLFRRYMKAESLRRVPAGALDDVLAFLRLAAPDDTYALIDSLTLWQHGEHFLEEIPDALLAALCEQEWPVAPGRLRQALQKLDTLLPTTAEDMIDCSAAAPMAHLLTMLVQQEGERALPDIRKYEKSHDPELVQTCLRLQLKLKGLTPPDEQDEVPAELQPMREALLADAALHHGAAEELTAERLKQAVICLREHKLPQHAQLLEDMLDEDGNTSVSEDTLPSLRVRYEDMAEPAPRAVLLRYLYEHPELIREAPGAAAPPTAEATKQP